GEKLVLSVSDREKVWKAGESLRFAEQQKALVLKGIMECRQSLSLEDRFQIDQHIAATDQVQPGKRRVFREIVPRENTYLSDGRTDLAIPALIGATKEPVQAFLRYIT